MFALEALALDKHGLRLFIKFNVCLFGKSVWNLGLIFRGRRDIIYFVSWLFGLRRENKTVRLIYYLEFNYDFQSSEVEGITKFLKLLNGSNNELKSCSNITVSQSSYWFGYPTKTKKMSRRRIPLFSCYSLF